MRQPEYKYTSRSPTLRTGIENRLKVWIDDCPFCGLEFKANYRYVLEMDLKSHRKEEHPGRNLRGAMPGLLAPPAEPKPPKPPRRAKDEPVDAVAWARDREFEPFTAAKNQFIIDYKAVPEHPDQVVLILELPRTRRLREVHVQVTKGPGNGGIHVKILHRGEWYAG